MYAKVNQVQYLRQHLDYHVQKIVRGKAACIVAENFMKDPDLLTLDDKLFHFERLNIRNAVVVNKTLDISLNFHPRDILTNTDMSSIAREYMKRLDLSGQPYLVYRHEDAVHPHAHVVVGRIKEDGRRLDVSPKIFHRSSHLCREIEGQYHLIQSTKGMSLEERQQDNAQRVVYGQKPVMPALSNVLNRVVPHYKYTSIETLNAVLRLYNAEAYRGKPDSHLYQHRGILYRVLDVDGKPTKAHIKASLFDSKPTLDQLELRFKLNCVEAEQPQHTTRVKMAVDWALRKEVLDIPELQKKLEKEQISLVMIKDGADGRGESYFVDHRNRTVYAGRDLGVAYERQGLEQRCVVAENLKEAEALIQRKDQRQVISTYLQ